MKNDDNDNPEERFGGRKDRRRPKRGRRRSELLSDAEPGDGQTFADAGLQALLGRGDLVTLGRQVRGGKEATVYRAEGRDGPLAAKVYSDDEVRGFQSDEAYTAGRRISDRRIRKMLGDARRRGLSPRLAHWVFHEYMMLWRLHDAGLPVPKPAVGPDPDRLVEAGRVVLMEWIGDEEPAPRLADALLEPAEAEGAWRETRSLLLELLGNGLVHGDLSTYNLLWWRGRVILIDLPQTVEIEHNRNASELLDRDIRSLCSSFRPFGIDEDPARLSLELRLEADLPPSGPLT